MHSEFAYGSMIADQLFSELYENEMCVCGHRLIGVLCREGFVARLAELLEVEVNNGMVDQTAVPEVDGRTGIISMPEDLPQGCVTEMGLSVRGYTRC